VADALDDRAFILDELHKAYHHYIKVGRDATNSIFARQIDP
jgi:hypothetical protein